MKETLPYSELIDYVRGLCSPERAAVIEARLSQDRALMSQVDDLRRYAEAARADRSDTAPPEWINRAKALLPMQPASSPRSILAALVMDSWRTPAVGLRSAGNSRRELTYHADGYGVDLLVSMGSGETVELIGALYQTVNGERRGLPGDISLSNRGRMLTFARAESFGEFEGEASVGTDTEMVISPMGDDVTIRIPLGSLLSEDRK